METTIRQLTGDLKDIQLCGENKIEQDECAFILNYAGAMITTTDKHGFIKLFNPEASRNIGYEESEVINIHTPLLFHDKNDITRKRKELFDEFGVSVTDDFAVLIEKAKRNTHEEEQYTYVRKDGTFFPVSLTITTIKDHDGEIIGFMGIAVDISVRKRVEEELRNALKKERELSELKTRFVSMASHEFRTPLSTILSSAYLIEKYTATEDQPKREKHLQRIHSSVTMLTDILNDFLNVGRIEEKMVVVRPERFNIHDLVTIIIGEMKNSLKKQQKIWYHHKGKTDVVMDASLFKHIVMNLVSNASKFSPETVPIEIKTTHQGDKIILSVKDHGIGISKEDQKHLTERFFRGANAGTIQGTGLGLHIVSKYAELMSGKIACISELDKGTEIIIVFKLSNQL